MPGLIVAARRRLLSAGAPKPLRSRRLEFPGARPDATAAAEQSHRFAPQARPINAAARSVDDRGGRQFPARDLTPLAPFMSGCRSGSWGFSFFPKKKQGSLKKNMGRAPTR